MNRVDKYLNRLTLLLTTFMIVAGVSLLTDHRLAVAQTPPVSVENIRAEQTDAQVKVTIASSGRVEHVVRELDAPPRLVIDLQNAVCAVKQKTIVVGHRVVKYVRGWQYVEAPEKVVRVVVDLQKPCPYTITEIGHQINITFLCNGDEGAAIGSEAGTASKESAEKQWRKEEPKEEQLLSLNLQGVTLKNILKVLSGRTGWNFMMSTDIAEINVNVYLSDVPVQGALSAILRANGLWYEKQPGTNIYVISRTTKRPPAEMVTEIITLNYASVSDLQHIVQAHVTVDGSFNIDSKSNSIVLSDIASNVEKVHRLLSELDRPRKQVLIEIKIVEVNLSAASELGISWDWSGKTGEDSPLGAAALAGSYSITSGAPLNLSIGKYASNVGVSDLKAAITALAKRGWADVLASPRILALDGEPASIKITEHIAMAQKVTYQATATGQVSVQEPIFGDVGITLTVTPHILNPAFTILDVQPSVSSARRSAFFPEQAVDTQERTAQTSVMVGDGQTIVLGGLLRQEKKTTLSKVPLLGDIPILGYLFRNTTTDDIRTEVTVFLTPHIVKLEEY